MISVFGVQAYLVQTEVPQGGAFSGRSFEVRAEQLQRRTFWTTFANTSRFSEAKSDVGGFGLGSCKAGSQSAFVEKMGLVTNAQKKTSG